MATTFRLVGLDADNLLAFLALLGTLRALDLARPTWRVRTRWSGAPWHPELTVDDDVDEQAMLIAVADGVAIAGAPIDFQGHKNIDFTRRQFRELVDHSTSEPLQARMLAAIGSDACTRRDGERIEGTALAAIAGQGHQNFLERVAALGRRQLQNETSILRQALLEPWAYEDLESTLRWDPLEDRRYALGFADPSGEKIKTSAGANILAVIGFPLFSAAPGERGLVTTAVVRQRRSHEVRWPIWNVPCGLATIEALLRHPDLAVAGSSENGGNTRAAWKRSGVVDIKRCRRIRTGKYFSFERAVSAWAMS
jgi:hypothetical protein